MESPILSVKNVSKTYPGPVYALKNVNLELYKGEIFGLLGVNGAGKTTLSSILATLHPPTSGDVLYNGVSIYTDIQAYRHALGFCPQKQNLDPLLNVEENLLFAGRYYLMPEAEIRERMQELLEDLALLPYTQFKIDALSGGTAQRVLIARALMHNPQIVILDEPTVGLDPDIRKKLWGIIKKLKNKGITVILTTHYLDEAEALSDRVCILDKGKIKLIESVRELKSTHNEQKLEDIFLEILEQYQHELPEEHIQE